jgi:hypothetical protein
MNGPDTRSSALAVAWHSTRRRTLALFSMLGLGLAASRVTAPAKADPADERPTEGDHLVAIDAAEPVPLEPKDITDSLVLAWTRPLSSCATDRG